MYLAPHSTTFKHGINLSHPFPFSSQIFLATTSRTCPRFQILTLRCAHRTRHRIRTPTRCTWTGGPMRRNPFLLPQFMGECRQEESGACVRPALRRTKTVWRNVVATRGECFSNIHRSALLWQKSSRKRKRGSSAFPFIPKQVVRYPPPACDDKDAFFDAPDTCQSRRRAEVRKE